jgi:hypothetical protein
MLILCLFGEKIFGPEKMNYIWSAISSSSCMISLLCVIGIIGTFWVGYKAVGAVGEVAKTGLDVAGRSFDNI